MTHRGARLLVQPDDGVAPLVAAIDSARSGIDLCVFRLAHADVEDALASAVERGVSVRALVPHASSDGRRSRRNLENRLLDLGASVSRTDDDLLRYHGKMMIVDGRGLFILGYNLTTRDIEESRSLGVMTEDPELVAEAQNLFDCDFERRTYTSGLDTLLVSPLNSRSCLLQLIEGARERLLIYDERVYDNLMQKAIERRARAGVDVRVIGRTEKELHGVKVERSAAERMHVRAIVQDDRLVFIGSQSLRRVELERRREIGVILSDREAVRDVIAIFDQDWIDATGEAEPLVSIAVA